MPAESACTFVLLIALGVWAMSAVRVRNRSNQRRSLTGDDKRGFVWGTRDDGRSFAGDDTVMTRSRELGRNVELAIQLGGPGILATYASDELAQQLYDRTVDLLGRTEGRGQLTVELEGPESRGSAQDPRMVVSVRYVLRNRPITTQIGGELVSDSGIRIVRCEKWVWGRTQKRCESCGAPSAPGLQRCEYCGAEVRDESRWVLVEIDTTDVEGAI